MKIELDTIYRRIVDHLENGTTDMAADSIEVPAAHFTDADHLARELEVFRRQPLAAATSMEIPEPGSFVTRDILGVPLLIVRQKDGSVAVFRNMCRHRGGKVEQGEKGKKPFFVCAYHGWSFKGDGSLRGIPFEEQYGTLDKGCRNLFAVEAEERHGLVWIKLPQAPQDMPIADYLGEADERLAAYDIDKLVVFMDQKIDLDINWKLVMDGAIDVLHPQFLHAEGVGKLIQTGAAVWLDLGRHGQSYSARKRLARKLKAGEPIEGGWRYLTGNLMIFPNMSVIPTPDHIEHWTVWPHLTDPGKCHVHIRFLTDPAKLTDEVAERINRSWEILRQAATEEDFPMEEMIQANAAALPTTGFLYGANEVPTQHLHLQMAREFDALA
ncbi:aromatic ring-hydroxylating dioxygenase subunit alpha [Sphingopyxis sp. OPL5]|uniref:aromatic ring-hydroxylating oxygenase subunit alpha n=1 Tax=Sphingopyxis sp. OPL5 TaxID=2486273 RepID=UPI00164D7BE6|nr:aromatic ring-hydroxylating dioxygenase subunit alpha [Sphingopyxis sp. OPL5]QNO28402.1 aromatic ring-hydroxylating dioxygenase subunit alpha [Sphingopyxis sp. OPL5]